MFLLCLNVLSQLHCRCICFYLQTYHSMYIAQTYIFYITEHPHLFLTQPIKCFREVPHDFGHILKDLWFLVPICSTLKMKLENIHFSFAWELITMINDHSWDGRTSTFRLEERKYHIISISIWGNWLYVTLRLTLP
jgi:hypothetical protein